MHLSIFPYYKQRLHVRCVFGLCTLRGQESYSIKWVSSAVITYVMTLTVGHFGAMCVVIDECSNYIQENNEWIGCSTWKHMIA